MSVSLVAAAASQAQAAGVNTEGLVKYLQGLFGPLFLGIVGIVALFFLFTREITRFAQFLLLAVAIAVIFYTPSIVHVLATGIANALGVH
jgi:type IV secretory pathway VirB2 component (pilin)